MLDGHMSIMTIKTNIIANYAILYMTKIHNNYNESIKYLLFILFTSFFTYIYLNKCYTIFHLYDLLALITISLVIIYILDYFFPVIILNISENELNK